MYKIIDLQGMGTHEGERFKTKAEIVEHLANYHSVDFTECLEDDDNRDIYEYLKQFKTTQAKLDFLCNYGEWAIEKV